MRSGWARAGVALVLGLTVGCAGFGNPFVGEWLDDDGHVLPDESVEGEGFVIDSWVVSGHCDWDSATFLLLSWPPGRVDADWVTSDIDDGSVRMYVRDPEGLFANGWLDGALDPDAELPDGAAASGLHRGSWEIWTDPDEASIYLVSPSRTERWPRAIEFIGCA